MDHPKKIARLAGLAYLVVVLTGMFSLAYVHGLVSGLKLPERALSVMGRVEGVYRWGLLSSTLCYLAFIALALLLYGLLKGVDARLSAVMAILVLVSVPVSFLNLQNELSALYWLRQQDGGQLLFYLGRYNDGVLLLEIFWGLWLLPLGVLIIRSGFLPKVLGFLLLLGGISYVLDFALTILRIDTPGFMTLPASIAEMSTCLWLLIAGVRTPRTV